jgi:hypothetical protein
MLEFPSSVTIRDFMSTRRDFSRAVPETFAMVGWSTGGRMVAVDVSIAHRGPRDVAEFDRDRSPRTMYAKACCGRVSVLSISAAVPVRARSRSPGGLALPQVLGVDVSAPMLARAAERLPPGAPVKFVRADATTYRIESAAFDLLFSSFGRDSRWSEAAIAHRGPRDVVILVFRGAGPRFCESAQGAEAKRRPRLRCWRRFDENPWLHAPLRAALEDVPPLPRPGPEDPGPFSFASERRVRRILADAGFQSVTLEPGDFARGIEEALRAAMALGPTSRVLEDQGPETRAGVCHVDPPRVATLSTR